jgi:hypothetical protein
VSVFGFSNEANAKFPCPVWSKHSSSLAVSKKFKYFNADELIEGTGNDKF